MEKQYIIIEPGLTYLKKAQVVTESYLNKAKKDFGFDHGFLSSDEKHQPFTYRVLTSQEYVKKHL